MDRRSMITLSALTFSAAAVSCGQSEPTQPQNAPPAAPAATPVSGPPPLKHPYQAAGLAMFLLTMSASYRDNIKMNNLANSLDYFANPSDQEYKLIFSRT